MAAYNVWLKEITLNEWTVEGGGTALEAIGKETPVGETLEGTPQPSTAKWLRSALTAKKVKAKLTLPAGLVTDLNAGAKVILLRIYVNGANQSGNSKRIKFGAESPAVSAEPETFTSQSFQFVNFSKAQAEEQTKASLEAMVIYIEKILPANYQLYEMYVLIETNAATQRSGTVTNKAALADALTGRKLIAAALTNTFITTRGLVGAPVRAGPVASTFVTGRVLAGASRRTGAVASAFITGRVLTGAPTRSGAVASTFITTRTLTAQKIISSTAAQRVGFVSVLIGQRTSVEQFSGDILESLGMTQQVSGVRKGQGAVSQTMALRSGIAGQSLRQGAVAGRLPLVQGIAGAGARAGSASQQIALQGALAGAKRGRGGVTQQVGFIQEYVGVVKVDHPGIATADVYLRYVALAEVAVDEATAEVRTDKATEEVAI